MYYHLLPSLAQNTSEKSRHTLLPMKRMRRNRGRNRKRRRMTLGIPFNINMYLLKKILQIPCPKAQILPS